MRSRPRSSSPRTIAVLLVVDVFSDEKSKWTTSSIAGIGLLAALIPVLSMAVDGTDRVLFDGAYVVDDFALVLKGLFLVAGYITILLSTNYIAEGDYWEGEYYLLVVSSVLGMTIMASSRDLITIFVALETLSIPAYLLAGFRKRDLKGNEAGLKYYLIGCVRQRRDALRHVAGVRRVGQHVLADIGRAVDGSFGDQPVVALGIVFTLVGFGFKVSAVPFQNWAPDTYEGAPTPITAFLSVASKAAGFVAILQLVFVGFFGRADVVGPMMWVLAALTMTVGNVIALRQTNIVRLFAYSSVAQAGFILAPLAVVSSTPGDLGVNKNILTAVIAYLLIYSIVNLGAFAVIIAVSRKTRSGEIASWAGLFEYAPGARGVDGDVPLRPRRHPTAHRLVRQVPGLLRARDTRDDVGLRARRGRRRELGDRALLLREHRPDDVHGRAARRRPSPDQGAGPVGRRRDAVGHRHGRRRLRPRHRRRPRRARDVRASLRNPPTLSAIWVTRPLSGGLRDPNRWRLGSRLGFGSFVHA